MAITTKFFAGFVAMAVAIGLFVPAVAVAEGDEQGGQGVALIDERTPWRAWVVSGRGLWLDDEQFTLRHRRTQWRLTLGPDDEHITLGRLRRDEVVSTEEVPLRERNDTFTPLPPRGWKQADFDDRYWPRYQADELFDYLGDYGVAVARNEWLTSLHLRTGFGIDRPGRVNDLKVTVAAIGGVVVYINGVEIGRGGLPEGELHPLTPAQPYPSEAYVDEHGEPLPFVDPLEEPEEQWLARYEKRIRRYSFDVPSDVLKRGGNVLAIEFRRAPTVGPMGRHAWNHLAFREMKLTSAGGEGVVSYEQALSGTRLWSAEALEPVAESPAEQSLVRRRWGWGSVGQVRGRPVKGTMVGNPFDPVRPIRMAAPRNGVASGQVVLSDLDGLDGITAALGGDFRGPGGAAMPASAVEIRFAAQHDRLQYCDALLTDPPRDARTVPVWLLLEVPRGQRPGWYESTLRLEANGERFTVPVRVLVTGYELPDPAAFDGSIVHLGHSPRAVAMQYEVEPWSDEHWRLLEASMALQAKVGNDLVFAPVILCNMHPVAKDWMGARAGDRDRWHEPMVRFIETEDGLKPDFTILERYLDLYARHNGPPRALTLGIWSASSASEVADAYEGRRRPSVTLKPRSPLEVLVYDPETGELSDREVPAINDDGGEALWRPVLEGVHGLVRRRGWDERTIMLGLGGDIRPGARTVERVREWAPWARWDLLSHFSGDPPSEDGRLIATGGLEIGVRAQPGIGHATTSVMEARLAQPAEYLFLPTARWAHADFSPPVLFRTLVAGWGRLGHMGLDFWQGTRNHGFWTHIQALAVPGPDGAVPTVRYQMLREGVQEYELRKAIVRAYLELDEDERAPYRELLDELFWRMGATGYISQRELKYDYPAYAAKVQQAAAELAGQRGDAAWDDP